MELSDITVTPSEGGSVVAELRGDLCFGDCGCWITINGWGGTEEEARAQIDAALLSLNLNTDKLRKAV